MRVGIDLDGTAWDNRELFIALCLGLRSKGHEFGIVTAHRGLMTKDLDLWKARGFPSVDFYFSRDHFEFMQDDTLQSWKERICRESKIDYLFDDFDLKKVVLIKY